MRCAPLPYCALGLALVILGGHAPDLSAATRAKENNSDALNLASSWTNNLIPGSADVALFDSTVTTPHGFAWCGHKLESNQLRQSRR
ncbi:MAG TPA: hypothetical protein VFZ59_20400 [Verrucomicrobiae bacterium]|nr:hypothetical protein [Verrucomicrobiae bacterium]